MTNTISPGTIVEVHEPGQTKGQYAVVIDPSPDQRAGFDHLEDRVWVRYDNGAEVPVREYYVRQLTTEQVLLTLNHR